MSRYEPIDRSPRSLQVVLSKQIQPGTFEFGVDHLVAHGLECPSWTRASATTRPAPARTTLASCSIMAPVVALEAAVAAIESAKCIGYVYCPYKPEVMHWFCKPSSEIRTLHLHLVPKGSPLWTERVAFRGALCASPQLSSRYAELKRYRRNRALITLDVDFSDIREYSPGSHKAFGFYGRRSKPSISWCRWWKPDCAYPRSNDCRHLSAQPRFAQRPARP